MPPEIQTFLLAMTPVGELRVSLPVALTVYQLNWGAAYLFSVLGNLVPVFFILLFLKSISDWLSKNSKFFQKFFLWFFQKTKQNHNLKFEKWGTFALAIFVAIPLPLTGSWTASIVAFLFGIPFRKAFPLITLGILAAGLIVSAATFAGISIERYFGLQVLTGILLAVAFIWIFSRIIKNKNNSNNN